MEFASIVKEYAGAAGIIVLILSLTIILLKQLLSLMRSTSDALAGLKKDINQGYEKQEARDREQDQAIQYIKDNYARKDDIYKELGGWKTELNRLSEHLDRNQKDQDEKLMKIMEILVKEKK